MREIRTSGSVEGPGRVISLVPRPKIKAFPNQLQNSKKAVTPAKAGVQRSMKRLDSRFRGNDVPGVLQLALPYIEYYSDFLSVLRCRKTEDLLGRIYA